jgi:hypothetical protein
LEQKGSERKKRKEIKANIFEEGKNTKKYNEIKKEERKRRTKNEDSRLKKERKGRLR